MQGIRDMLTQRQSQYAWEAYLKHRKLEQKTDRASHSEEKIKIALPVGQRRPFAAPAIS